MLTRLNLVVHEPKKARRNNYISWIEKLGCWLCGWLDDHSRFVPVAEYLTEATSDNVIKLFEKGVRKFGYPKQTLSDRGTQFYSNLGETCRFLEHMRSKGVEHIYSYNFRTSQKKNQKSVRNI